MLTAADTLSLQPVANAYETVLVDLRQRLVNEADAVQRRLLGQSLAVLEALVKTSAKLSEAARDVVPVPAQDLV